MDSMPSTMVSSVSESKLGGPRVAGDPNCSQFWTLNLLGCWLRVLVKKAWTTEMAKRSKDEEGEKIQGEKTGA